ncbi:MAG TPA: hypothetical protein VLL08_23285 [Kineosporiaceae bacterium]|nr:hypothetical protein [Kineosporiaceae bacterium]
MARLAAALIAVVGVLLVVAGGLQATVFASSAVTRAELIAPRQSVITTAVGLLGLEGPRVQVDVTDGGRRQVFIGIGRAGDVDAYLAQVSRLEVTGQDGDGGLLTKQIGSQPSLPDPAGVDIWVTSVRGTGTANLAWPDAPGQWRLVVATDGAAKAPDDLRLTWSGREVHSVAPTLIAIGLVLVVVGLITVIMLGSRARLAGDS